MELVPLSHILTPNWVERVIAACSGQRLFSSAENMRSAVQTLVDAGPDAIQLTAAAAASTNYLHKDNPAIDVRTEIANVDGDHHWILASSVATYRARDTRAPLGCRCDGP